MVKVNQMARRRPVAGGHARPGQTVQYAVREPRESNIIPLPAPADYELPQRHRRSELRLAIREMAEALN